eukprot:g28087.t1
MGAICTVEHDQQVARGIAITPSLKMSEIKLTGEAYCACANDEWQDDVPGGQRASAEQVEEKRSGYTYPQEASFAMNLHAAKTEASGPGRNVVVRHDGDAQNCSDHWYHWAGWLIFG